MSTTEDSKRPNIIIILADDMGYADIGCFGSEIRTPNINRLAEEGVKFSQMYNCARCCPTRASLLTGLYPHQAGVGCMVTDWGLPGYRGFLSNNCVTIAETLKTTGYKTYMSGKWHVGGNHLYPHFEAGAPCYPTPTQRGFDRFWGIYIGASSYFDPQYLMQDDKFIKPEPEAYFTDSVSDHACTYIDEAAQGDSPFFLYLAYTAPHWPLHAMPEDIARYEGSYRKGWDETRTTRHESLKGLGILNAKWDISPRDDKAPNWNELDPNRQHWEDQRMAVYAAQIDRMDQGIGHVMHRLESHGITNDTLVLFLSDNGGCAELLSEDGFCVPCNPYTHDGRKVQPGNRMDISPGDSTTYMSYDLPWANVSNSPFRLYKHWVHEGGISTPLVARWPNGIPTGGLCHEPCHVVDIAPTCLEAANAEYPKEFADNTIHSLDGECLLPAMRNQPWRRDKPIFFEHEGNRAVRDGQWKLVSRHGQPWELYDMHADRTELHNMYHGNETLAEKYVGMYENWAQSHAVADWEIARNPVKRNQLSSFNKNTN